MERPRSARRVVHRLLAASRLRPTGLVRAACLALALLPAARAVEAPWLVGRFALGAAPSGVLAVAADGTRVLLEVRGASATSAQTVLIDTSDPAHPAVRAQRTGAPASGLALSEDGRRALLLQRTDAGRPNTAGSYQVLALDFSEPGNPRTAWERTAESAAIALAPDASAFAFAQRTDSFAGPGIVKVVGADGSERPMEIGGVGTSRELRLAPGGRFLAASGFGWAVVDGASRPALSLERSPPGVQSEGCVLAVMPDGQVVVEDTRAPRFAVYAFAPGLPRIAKVPFEARSGGSCAFLRRGQAAGLLLLERDHRVLHVLDVGAGRPPRLSPPLLLPLGSTAAGIDAKGRIYTLRSEGGLHRLEIYDSTRMSPPSADWIGLERARQEALRLYAGPGRATDRAMTAVQRFEAAGALGALGAPVAGIPAADAAAILNDYAFLLGRAGFAGDPDAIALLRRAIELDPTRRVAYLNLAEALRQSLPFEPGSREAVRAEARAAYAKYRALGGRPVKELQAWADDAADSRAGRDICRAVVEFANAGRVGELLRASATDIPVGPRKLDVLFTTEGTAHVPAIYAWDAADDRPVEDLAVPIGEGLWGGDQLGLVVFRGAAHVLHYRDLKHPVASAALDGSASCDFEATTVEQAGPGALEPELCANIDRFAAAATLEFEASESMSPEEVSTAYRETAFTGSRLIDIANDGHPIRVGSFGLTSGAGAGCDETFFDEVDEAAAHFRRGPARDRLMALQAAEPDGRYPLKCGNAPRFFTWRGSVYFENKPSAWPPMDDFNSYHRVARIRGDVVEDVCHFAFRTTVRLARGAAPRRPPATK